MMNEQLLLSFYGDDLTGSTDAMEALSLAGIDTVLFVRPPEPSERARFAGARAVGLAGTSRSRAPAWMDEQLPPAFAWLRSLAAPICHYKVCSTFDSSAAVGSIGRAIELGAKAFGQSTTPLVVGVPQLGRYTFFGQLFAAYGTEVHRIDRHPVMSRHPVTPMREADLRLHLAEQTALPISIVDLPTLGGPCIDARVDQLAQLSGILLFDVADQRSQAAMGRQLLRLRQDGGRFVAGSSGVEYGLIAAWRATGTIGAPPVFAGRGPVERIAVVSGSVSPTTERQIRHAARHGFELLSLGLDELIADGGAGRAIERALAVLSTGASVILATALGPSSTRQTDEATRHEIGRRLGVVLAELVRRANLPRAVVAGGDTSSHALAELGVLALRIGLPLPRTPGSPLCRSVRADGAEGPELAFKGGQIGADDYFVGIRDGTG